MSRLAVFTKNFSNPAYAAARLGADRAARRFGGSEVRHYVPETPDDAEQQSVLIHEALATVPDAFVFTPVHPTRVDEALACVHAAGIPVFGFVNPHAAARYVSYCGASDAQLAQDIAQHLFEHLQGRGRVVVVEGPADSVTSIERVNAFVATAARYPGIALVAHCNGRYQRGAARDAFASVLAAQPAIDAVLCANDIMAIGVLDALQAAGRSARVCGVNAIPQAIDAIREGRMLATADFNAMQMCFTATECALRHLRGEAVPRELALPVGIVDRSNCSSWDRPYAERPLLTLEELACNAVN
jgi:ribose transport system substrate-binding protein